MKKNIVLFASLLASLFIAGSCQKYDVQESVDENATVSSLSVKATLATATGEGMKTTIAADDVLRVRFVDASGKVLGRTQMLTNKTGKGASATFSADAIAIPNGAQDMQLFLDNRTIGKINYGSTPTKADFLAQDGTLASAQGLQIIGGKVKVGSDVSVDLSYGTTIVKAEVSYPEGVEPKEGETTITLAVNAVGTAVIGDFPTGAKENITVNAKVDTTKKTASAYIAVLVMDLQDGTLFSNVGSTRYGCDIAAKDFTVGKTLVINKKMDVLVYNLFIPDEEYTIDVVGEKVSGDDFITVAGGKLTVAENKTGKIRKGSVALNNGKEYIITQIGPNEFKGTYSFSSRLFCANNPTWCTNRGLQAKTTDPGVIDVTFGETYKGETLTDQDGKEYTNQIGIHGIHGDAIMDATIVIDYKSRTAKLGLLLDARNNAQATNESNKSGYGYVCFLPEMGNEAFNKWNFIQVDLAKEESKDFLYLWFDCSEDFTSFTWDMFANKQYNTRDNKDGVTVGYNRIIGITCAVSKSNKVDKDNVLGANSNANYNIIFQANTSSGKAPMSFVKK